jgi:uncharacterized protein (DUF2141 family)
MIRLISIFAIFAFFVCSAAYAQTTEKEESIAIAHENPENLVSYNGVKPKREEKTYSITITVTDIRNDKGVIRFKFFDDTTPFPHDTGFLKIVVDKQDVVNGTLTRTFYGFKSQPMAIALLDDENSDLKLDMGWFFPKEGHAFSDYYHTAIRRPVYEDFRFILKGNRKVVMKMRYY